MFPDDDDSLKQSAGSPAFLAPELCAAGTIPHGKLVDIWALGVTLYCFIFGKVPFMAENVLDIYDKIRNTPYALKLYLLLLLITLIGSHILILSTQICKIC